MMKLFIALLLTMEVALLREATEAKKVIAEGGSFEYAAMTCRAHSFSVEEFGAVGDGKTLNTAAFRKAVGQLSRYSSIGGALLYVPRGRWLTGSFNLTSHFTLFLHRDAVLLASRDIKRWPMGEPLPSYGHGREAPGGRYMSFIFGTNLTDVIVTGSVLRFEYFFDLEKKLKFKWSLDDLQERMERLMDKVKCGGTSSTRSSSATHGRT